MNTKDSLRERVYSKRKNLSEKERLDAEDSLLSVWESVKDSYKADKIALYWSVNGEIPTNSLISCFLKSGSECFLPVISDDKEDKLLEFSFYEEESSLTKNRLGIPEPSNSKFVDLTEIDIVFLPCVCFDSRGNRIGMGGGFYDRTLSKLPDKRNNQLIILAYDFQEVESCLPEIHDVRANACLTPTNFFKFKD